MKKKERIAKHFYNGKVFYDEKSYQEHVRDFPDLPLTKKDFDWLGFMLCHTIWMQLESNGCIPSGGEWNRWLDKFFLDSLDKFLKEKDEKD